MKRPQLLIIAGKSVGEKFDVKDGGTRLGRSSSNDIHIPDEELSRNHCLFEPSGETGIRVIDLASANGTAVNGVQLGSEPRELAVGDVIEVGATAIEVVGDRPAPVPSREPVDLGLENVETAKSGAPSGSPRRHIVNLLWVVAAGMLIAAIVLVFFFKGGEERAPELKQVANNVKRELLEICYEKVEADTARIFRYELTFSRDRVLKVEVDHVPDESRHLVKNKRLKDEDVKRLCDILDFTKLSRLDPEYSGNSSGEGALKSRRLSVVYSDGTCSVYAVNAIEPDDLRDVCEKLETFSQSEFGIWAIQYSGEKLVEMAEDSVRLARQKWQDRDVQYGNLHASISAFRRAEHDLDTVNPKPAIYSQIRKELEDAERELDRRFRDQRFNVDRALNMGEWNAAARELSILMEMIPDREDSRYKEAESKLIDVEKRLKTKGVRR
jgi:hypothetical protein